MFTGRADHTISTPRSLINWEKGHRPTIASLVDASYQHATRKRQHYVIELPDGSPIEINSPQRACTAHFAPPPSLLCYSLSLSVSVSLFMWLTAGRWSLMPSTSCDFLQSPSRASVPPSGVRIAAAYRTQADPHCSPVSITSINRLWSPKTFQTLDNESPQSIGRIVKIVRP